MEQGLPDGAEWVNVMLGLVEEKAERYVKMFGLCPCPRCVADVKALALTRLLTKYVVLPAEHKNRCLAYIRRAMTAM
ncbi:late competence development ComFB family protein [Flavonifractor plautii]|nr:late competence development ComFB family protein [Flavonifractor plautii]